MVFNEDSRSGNEDALALLGLTEKDIELKTLEMEYERSFSYNKPWFYYNGTFCEW